MPEHEKTEVKNKKKCKKRGRPRKESGYSVWSDDDEETLRRVYPTLSPPELLKLFPNRTTGAIHKKASSLGIVKSQKYVLATKSANPSKKGIAHLTDYAADALSEKFPQLRAGYDNLLEELLSNPAVDPENALQVEMLKMAALKKVEFIIIEQDRIRAGLKGSQLFINPKTGDETWVEARYPHATDSASDFKMARQILKDLGILKEQTQKVEILNNIRFLWEKDEDDEDNTDLIDVEAKTRQDRELLSSGEDE
ncbi:MAG: hypothetical protein IBX39_09645 [Candidatus Methanoperedenaceae archaeon]|nr:hypothetical protein [Candidatus Methanoperedenaceae archaeon]